MHVKVEHVNDAEPAAGPRAPRGVGADAGVVATVGALNLDVVLRVEQLPRTGETVLARSMTERPGGKAANQAVAAARVGPVVLVGCVGTDAAGESMLDEHHSAGIDVTQVRRVDGLSGRAIIEVDDAGDNRIVVVAGAGDRLTAEHTSSALDTAQPTVVSTQLESPRAVTDAVADWAHRHDRRFVLNPSPAVQLPETLLAAADPLIVNEGEAQFFANVTDDADVMATAEQLARLSRSVVVTLGAKGAVVVDATGSHRITADDVEVVDTTGAGDVFTGTLAAYLARGADLRSAACHATRTATDHVCRQR